MAELVSRLIDEARSLAGAEIELVKARVGAKMAAYKSAIIFFAIAGVLAFGAFIALLIGLILSLSTLIGPAYATVAVVGVTAAIAGILAFVGKSRLSAPRV